MNIYLIGYRCTGKTSVGKRLAEKLNRSFADTDRIVEKRSGMRIAEIVSCFGWEDFRRRETEALAAVARENRLVVSTGGGIIVSPGNIDIMRRTGIVVWLAASAETIMNRMRHDHETATLRPSLTDRPFNDEIVETLNERYPLYSKAHHLRMETDAADIDSICKQIMEKTRCPDAR